MKTRTLLWVLLIFSCASANGQSSLPPVYEIKADTLAVKLDDKYWQMLEDSAGKWNIKDVITSPITEKFHPNNTATTGFGYGSLKHYWQRLRLKNITGKDVRIVFNNSPYVDRFDLFVFYSNGQQNHLVSGWGVPYSKRDSFKNRQAVPVMIVNGEEIVIYKQLLVRRNQPTNKLAISFTLYDEFVKNTYIDEPWYLGDVLSAFTAGLLIFGFFLNIFFFRIVREKVYLYYSLLLLFEGLWYISISIRLFRENAILGSYFEIIFTHVAFFFSVTQFVRHFLKTFKYYPRWDKLLLILTIINLSYSFSSVAFDFHLPYSARAIPGLIGSLFFTATILALLLTFMFPKKERDKFTILSIWAAIPVFLVWIFIYGTNSVNSFFTARYNFVTPPIFEWLERYSYVIEMFCVAWFAILFTWILLQKYALLRKQLTNEALARERERNELINQQKIELKNKVEERTSELKKSIEELKATQHQLVQSEKMASLGELTAGIAHEIQNPLNFVNNFSEVNKELLKELNEEIEKGNYVDAKSISKDVIANEEKINHHGKRADAIVKGMLQHSRSSSGVKEPTDIVALCDEYMRLSYHGLRAKDKSFNATIKTDFDPAIEKIYIIPQDIGRVILNLLTNAFYAVSEKKKQQPEGYEPTVSISTKKIGDKVEIKVTDNGNGIPQKVLDKIFQPFFTTKPAGQGTGLGLSLSYDIITKGHVGELKVETKEGEGTSFIIILPIKLTK